LYVGTVLAMTCRVLCRPDIKRALVSYAKISERWTKLQTRAEKVKALKEKGAEIKAELEVKKQAEKARLEAKF